jgi:hypothetical protein
MDPREHSGGVPGTTGSQDQPPRWTNHTSPGSNFAITTGLAGDFEAHGKQAVVLFSCKKTEDDQITFTAYTCVEKGSQSFPGISIDLHVATIMDLANANKTQLVNAGVHSALRFDSLAPIKLSRSPDKPKEASRDMATLFEDLWTRPTPREPFRQPPYTCSFRCVNAQDIEKYRQHLEQGGEPTGNQPITYETLRTKQFLNVLDPSFKPKPITLSTMFDGASVQLSAGTPRTNDHENKVLKTRVRNRKTQRNHRERLAAAKKAKSVSPALESESSRCRPQANHNSASQISSGRTDTMSVPLTQAARDPPERRRQDFMSKSSAPNRLRHSEISSRQNMDILNSLLPDIGIRAQDPNSNRSRSVHGAENIHQAHYLHPDSACQSLNNRFRSSRSYVHNPVLHKWSPEPDNPPDSQSHHHISTMAREIGGMNQARAPGGEWSGNLMNQHVVFTSDTSLVPVHGTSQYADINQYGGLNRYNNPHANQYGRPAHPPQGAMHNYSPTMAFPGSQDNRQSSLNTGQWSQHYPNQSSVPLVHRVSVHDVTGQDAQGLYLSDHAEPRNLFSYDHQSANAGLDNPNSGHWTGGR